MSAPMLRTPQTDARSATKSPALVDVAIEAEGSLAKFSARGD